MMLVTAMYFSLTISYWLTLALAVPAAGFMVRIFIIFHDCGHGSFFASRRISTFVGFIAGLVTFAPYYHWNHKHAIHHATSGDLDRRGMGDVWTQKDRFVYQFFRNPLIMIVIGPLYMFLISNRFVMGKTTARERYYVYATNLALLGIIILAGLTIGIKAYLLIQIPIIMIGGGAGIWLFYVQHQFEDVYWARQAQWDFQQAAIQGSSFYKLPRVLQWFSGNIGFHHVHHLSARIPNYHLEWCHNELPAFSNVKPLTLSASLKCIKYRLWDEENKRLVGYKDLRG
jgi:omega-6 fatty acid desaturase (delta-12 desaturase)